jgi:hypothetical protein
VVLVGPQDGWIFGGGDVDQLIEYAAFAQADFKFTNSLSLFVGMRAEDARFVIGTPDQLATKTVGVEDDKNYCNFSASPIYKISDVISIYANAQVGTVFNPSTDGGVNSGADNFNQAQLYEGGLKFNFNGGKLYFTTAYFGWTKVSLAQTPLGEQGDNERADGAELEFSWTVHPKLTITGSFGAEQAFFRGQMPFGTTPFTPEEVALYSGSIEYGPFGETDSGSRYANNPHGLSSGFPEENANLFFDLNLGHGIGIGVGPTYTSGFWLDEEHTLHLPSAVVWDGNIFYKGKRIDLFLRFTNFTDVRYFLGSSFADTMLVTQAPPFQTSFSARLKF